MNLWSEHSKAFKKCPLGSLKAVCMCVRVCVFASECARVANEAGRAAAAVCPSLISALCGAAGMSGEVKWGVINLNEVQLFSHLLIIAG